MYYETVRYPFEVPDELRLKQQVRLPVVVVGAGPVGLSAALALAKQGTRLTIVEDDDTVSHGSRALGMSRRTMEIWRTLGAVSPIERKGLSWNSGYVYRGTKLVSLFEMDQDPLIKYPPMTNIQQCWVDQALLDALSLNYAIKPRWKTRFVDIEQDDDCVRLEVECPAGTYQIEASYVVACDGARSAVRKAMNLRLEGQRATTTFLIADIRLDCDLPSARRVWFDASANPGSSILMHKQPDGIWRLDFQLTDTADVAREASPAAVKARIEKHLAEIGQATAFSIEWISTYQAHSMTLERYRHGRVLFAGDAAHLVPIFGIRGLNSGVEDAFGLAWRLSCVLRGDSPAALLDTYSSERVHAALENIREAGRSAAFMCPPTPGFRAVRDAVLELVPASPEFGRVLNPRQGRTVSAKTSSLNSYSDRSSEFSQGPEPGDGVPDIRIAELADGLLEQKFLLEILDPTRFTVLAFAACDELVRSISEATAGQRVQIVCVECSAESRKQHRLIVGEHIAQRFGASAGTVYLIRPDQLVCARWKKVLPEELKQALAIAAGKRLSNA